MSLARAAVGGVLRRLAGSGPEPRRRAAAAAAAAAAVHAAGGLLASLSPPSPARTRAAVLFAQAGGSTLFHTTARRPARRRRRFNSVRAAEMGLVDEAAVARFAEEHFPAYTADEEAAVAADYTPGQRAALAAGEAAIDARDLAVQGRLRTDAEQAAVHYVDAADFRQVLPVIDKRARDPAAAARVAADARIMDEDVFADDLVAWLSSFVPADVNLRGLSEADLLALAEEHGPGDADLLRYWFERPSLVRRDGTTRITEAETGNTSAAAALPAQVPTTAGDGGEGRTRSWTSPQDAEDDALDETGYYRELKQRTGLTVAEMMEEVVTKVLVVRFVHNQTRLGKVRSASVVAVAGNGRGRLGLGIAKSTEFSTAVSKAKAMAIRTMRPVPRYEDRTIYGNVEVKISGTVVQLFARPPGFGLRVPHRLFEMARAAGIADLAARIPRSRNPMNSVKAAYQALLTQPDPEAIATGRGKKLVDVRKVYYGGAVY